MEINVGKNSLLPFRGRNESSNRFAAGALLHPHTRPIGNLLTVAASTCGVTAATRTLRLGSLVDRCFALSQRSPLQSFHSFSFAAAANSRIMHTSSKRIKHQHSAAVAPFGTHAPAAAAASSSAAATAAPLVPTAATTSATHTYYTHLLTIATAQIARDAGFSHTRQTNLTTLREVAEKYIDSIGYHSARSAAIANRSESNAYDILYGLQQMGIEWSEIRGWGQNSDALPFPHALPPLPLTQPIRMIEPVPITATTAGVPANVPPTVLAEANAIAPRPPHIPAHLPSLPAKRTYAYTCDVASEQPDAAETRKRRVEENRKLESALVKLHQAAHKAALESLQQEAESESRVIDALVARARQPLAPPAAAAATTAHAPAATASHVASSAAAERNRHSKSMAPPATTAAAPAVTAGSNTTASLNPFSSAINEASDRSASVAKASTAIAADTAPANAAVPGATSSAPTATAMDIDDVSAAAAPSDISGSANDAPTAEAPAEQPSTEAPVAAADTAAPTSTTAPTDTAVENAPVVSQNDASSTS